MKTKLNQLDKNLRIFIASYLIVLGIGVTTGLIYIYLTTSMTPSGTVEQYIGNNDEWEPKLAKEFIDLVSQAHTHIITFSFIFLSTGLIFMRNSIIKGPFKLFLIIEPFLSIIVTFGGFFILRYITSSFVYVIIISSTLMYTCFYIMIFVSIYDLTVKTKEKLWPN